LPRAAGGQLAAPEFAKGRLAMTIRKNKMLNRPTRIEILTLAIVMVAITVIHYFTPPSQLALHLLYRRLYYIPIIYAAFRFGLAGGLSLSVITSLIYAPHAIFFLGVYAAELADNLMEIIMFNIVGALTGLLVQAERRQAERYHQTAEELERSYLELKNHAEALEGMQAYISNIIDSLANALIVIDVEGIIARANPAAITLLGLGRDPNGQQLANFSFYNQGMKTAVEEFLAGDKRSTYLQSTLSLEEHSIPAAIHLSRLLGPKQERLGAVLVIEDLTTLKNLEEQLRQAERVSALGKLAGSLAHEIRNPLGIIRATAQLMEKEKNEKSLKELVAVVKKESDRVNNLVSELLNYARPTPPQMKPLSLDTFFAEIVSLTKGFTSQHKAELELDLAPDLPTISGDKERLRQCLVNLIFNAVQSMPEGGRVKLRAYAEDQQVIITVTDEGAGIPAQDLPYIFDPFFSTKAGGTGLGLAIVYRIIEEHHGRIEAESKGKGTTMRVRLPAKPLIDQAEAAS